jgi:hypothetical protein
VSVRGLLISLVIPLALAGCSIPPSPYASDEMVAANRFANTGPTSLTLYTVINNTSGSGAHLALGVNGSERVLFDPAGSFAHPTIAERNDVIIGFNPALRRSYIDYHARVTFRIVEQELLVSPQVAEMALRKVYANGAVPQAQCSHSITDILNDLPGFEGFKQTYYPKKAMDQFGLIPGVKTQTFRDDDPDVKVVTLQR